MQTFGHPWSIYIFCLKKSKQFCSNIHNQKYSSLCFLKWWILKCFELLSCCRSQSPFSFGFLTDCVTFARRICWYLVESILPSTRVTGYNIRHIIDSPPCLPVGCSLHQMLHLFLQTELWWLCTKSSIFTWWVHNTYCK